MYEIKDIDSLKHAFPADVSDLLPPYEEIPSEFKTWNNPAHRFITTWFFDGLDNPNFTPKEGVETERALLHIDTVLRSFQPKHEHKTAGCAFLLNEWFEVYTSDNFKEKEKRRKL